MEDQAQGPERVFKTAWFAKAARKASIADDELCLAIKQMILGQTVNLGGGVFKKRLGENRYRSIILVRGRHHWVYEYLFAKKDRDNIEEEELTAFRKLARTYETLSEHQVEKLIRNRDWMEICHGS